MAEVQRFDTWRQRAALIQLAENPEFLSTAEGAAFLEQLHHSFASSMVWMSRKMGFSIEADEVVNTIIENLLEHDGRVAGYAASAEEEPLSYLAVCVQGWVRRLWGNRGSSLDVVLEFMPEPYRAEPDDNYTPIDEVVARTFELLAPLTPSELHAELFELLGWLAANPPQRVSYEKADRRAAHRHCPSLTIGQVTAVMNIVYGGRPRNAATSLFRAFLLDSSFTISQGSTNAVALEGYKRRMIAERHGSRSLADWN